LKKLTHRGNLPSRLFQWLKQETVEKVQQEDKSFKPFQGNIFWRIK
jgi:hypothetical protein